MDEQQSTEPISETPTENMSETIPAQPVVVQPESNPERGPNPPHRLCGFCENKEEILKQTQEYIDSAYADKPKTLFLIELALKLKIHRDTLWDWVNKKTEKDESEHRAFSDMVKIVEQIQELQLQKRVLGRYNPTGAIFLLKTKHGYMETEKKLLGGDKSSGPLEIILTEARNLNDEQ